MTDIFRVSLIAIFISDTDSYHQRKKIAIVAPSQIRRNIASNKMTTRHVSDGKG
jgi:hypothetical protein